MANVFVVIALLSDERLVPVRLEGLENVINKQRLANIIEFQQYGGG
jgi:hypothetical protein